MPTLVQSASNTATSGTTITVTLSSTGAGNCLVVCVGSSTSSVSNIKLGGSADNFAVAKAQTDNAGGLGTIDCEVWTDQNCAGGQTSVVVTFAGTVSNAYAWVMEWSGVSAVSAVDKTNGGGANAAAFSSGSSGVLTNASEVVIGAVTGAALGAVTITGPSSPWTNLSLLSSGNYGFIASYETVTATTAQTYSGTVSGPTTQFYAAVIVTLTEASGGPAGTVQPRATVPVPRRQLARGQWQRVTGQAFVKVAAPAQQPAPAPRRKPARAWVQFKPVRTTNAAAGAAVSGTVQPKAAVPVPRRQPARALWRGIAVPGTYGTTPAPQFRTAPRRTLARALWRGITGQAFVKVPAPRQQYRTPPRRKLSRAYVRFTPVTTTNSTVTRQLLISLASQAGTDDYGNAYPQGILANAGVIEGPTVIAGTAPNTQVVLTDNISGTGEIQFQPNNPAFLMGVINSAVIGSPTYDSIGIIGPASTASGFGDYVEQAFNSANSAGTSTANWQIFYVDTSGGGHLVAVVDANGWTFNGPVTFDGSVTFNGSATFNAGATITGGLTVDTINGSSSTGAGDNGGVTSGPSGTVSAFPAAGPNHTHAELHHHPI